jgi:hypothetical protein
MDIPQINLEDSYNTPPLPKLDFQSLMRLKGITKAKISRHLEVSSPTAKKYYDNPGSMNIASVIKIADLASISPSKILESIEESILNG